MTLFGLRVTLPVTGRPSSSGVGGRGKGQPDSATPSLLVIPLGEASRAQILAAVGRHFRGNLAVADPSHADGAQAHRAHADRAHADQAHADQAHADRAHADRAHADQAHADRAQAGGARPDSAQVALPRADRGSARGAQAGLAGGSVGASRGGSAGDDRGHIVSTSQADTADDLTMSAPRIALEWFDRGELRRRPLRTLARLWRRRFAAAVLVAPDLAQRRLRLTSFLLSLPPAQRKWRIDLHGNREAFSTGTHLAQNTWPIARHFIACAVARTLGEPLLRALDARIKPRQLDMERPQRILYLRSQLWLGLAGGGSVAHTAGVIGGLEQAGVTVQVVSSDQLAGVTAATKVVAPETWFDGRVRELEDVAYNVAFGVAALRTARRTRPQAIYQRHTAFNCSGAALSRIMNLPLVLEFNSSELWKGRYWGGLHYTRMAALVERLNLRAADRVVVVSDVLRRELLAKGLAPEKVVVNPNAVDPDAFGPHIDGSGVRQRLGLGDTVVVGFSGTFGLWHGIPTLAAVLSMVQAQRPNTRWLLIGDGPLRRQVKDAIDAHQLEPYVCLSGMVPHANMPAYLAACDVLISPHGRQADGGEFFGSPTKLFEYMAAARPIVASAVGQIADVLEHERTALLVPPDDADALCAAIVRLVDDAALRETLGRNARQTAIERHTWRQNADRLLDSLR